MLTRHLDSTHERKYDADISNSNESRSPPLPQLPSIFAVYATKAKDHSSDSEDKADFRPQFNELYA